MPKESFILNKNLFFGTISADYTRFYHSGKVTNEVHHYTGQLVLTDRESTWVLSDHEAELIAKYKDKAELVFCRNFADLKSMNEQHLNILLNLDPNYKGSIDNLTWSKQMDDSHITIHSSTEEALSHHKKEPNKRTVAASYPQINYR